MELCGFDIGKKHLQSGGLSQCGEGIQKTLSSNGMTALHYDIPILIFQLKISLVYEISESGNTVNNNNLKKGEWVKLNF